MCGSFFAVAILTVVWVVRNSLSLQTVQRLHSISQQKEKIMFGKLITCFTLVCFTVTLFGCSSQEEISSEALPVREKRISEVITTSGEVYSFISDKNGYYAMLMDTIIVGTLQNGKKVTIPMSQVTRVSVMRLNAVTSTLVVVGGILVVVAIAVAAKQSCPFVYSYNGDRYVFDGEPYGGAICEGLKRPDWCRLEYLKPVSNEYRLLLTNEVDETQYTDEFKLWIVDHRPGLDVMVDADGKLYTVDHPFAPHRALDSKGNNILRWVSAKDPLFWESDMRVKDPKQPADYRDTLYLSFPRPKDNEKAKLVVSGSTTLWGSQMLKRMTELRGEAIQPWFTELKSPAVRQLLDFWNKREELYHLQVKLRVGSAWVTRGDIMGGGPFVTEERVVPLDLSGVEGDTLNIMLAPPAGFWQLDRFAVDYSADEPLDSLEVAATKAVGHDGADLLGTLNSADGNYYVSPVTGQTATLVFPAPPEKADRERAILAKVSGYYDMRMDETGKPQSEKLTRIAFEPGYPVQFALEEFIKWRTELLEANRVEREKKQ
ncbi:MAG TPA: hypothetical protein DGH68_07600 [Bacteroidetes bacterium]|jgi:hypothetical protein|nr:hypothetical protein [Bacteroidota bacterium]